MSNRHHTLPDATSETTRSSYVRVGSRRPSRGMGTRRMNSNFGSQWPRWSVPTNIQLDQVPLMRLVLIVRCGRETKCVDFRAVQVVMETCRVQTTRFTPKVRDRFHLLCHASSQFVASCRDGQMWYLSNGHADILLAASLVVLAVRIVIMPAPVPEYDKRLLNIAPDYPAEGFAHSQVRHDCLSFRPHSSSISCFRMNSTVS